MLLATIARQILFLRKWSNKMEKVKEIIKKVCTKEVITYIIFGILTTIINIIISYLLKAILKVEGNLASTIGIICSILFAYITNKIWVFASKAKGIKENVLEFAKFILGRAATMIIEIIGVFILNDVIHLFYTVISDDMAYLVNKCIITVIVIILNFFISKFFAFKK